jgi:hypothetical protein
MMSLRGERDLGRKPKPAFAKAAARSEYSGLAEVKDEGGTSRRRQKPNAIEMVVV